MNIKSIISLLLIVVCIGITNATQFILSFTPDYNTFLMIDISTGDLVFNQTMPRYYQVAYVDTVNFETSTVSFFCNYNTMKGGDYIMVDYHWDTNSFSNKSKVILVDGEFVYYDSQSFVKVDNQIYIPTYYVTNLTIAYFNFNTYTFGNVSYNCPNYNQSVAAIGTYDPTTNKYYSLYYTDDLNANIVSLNVPLVEGDDSGIEITSFPRNSGNSNGITYSVGLGNLLFTPSGQFYYIERFQFNITIYEINLSKVETKVVFTIPMVYSWFFEEHYASADNRYLIFMSGPSVDSPNTPITYTFIDTQTWTSVYTFSSPNYFQTKADIHDNMFYFGGSF